MNEEMLRLVDSIHRDKKIDINILYDSLEQAMLTAARRKNPGIEELKVRIDRETGDMRLLDGDRLIRILEPSEFGRIAAQTAKQIMIQKIREAERDVVFGEYEARAGELVNGTVQRIEHGTVIVNLGRTEGIVPRQEQAVGESYHPGASIRTYIRDVRKKGQRVMIILSRTAPELVQKLFEQEVPEIYEHTVEIKGLVREAGYRTKIAVASSDTRIDPVGACVGVRGSRIKNIVDELNGEKIDIVRWNESEEIFIQNALSPAAIESVSFNNETRQAKVIVPEDQLSLAIGKKGQNVRLSSRLTEWELVVMTVDQQSKIRQRGRREIESLPGVGENMVNNLLLAGIESFDDVMSSGIAGLMEIKGIGEKKAEEMIAFAEEGLKNRSDEDLEDAEEETAETEEDILEETEETEEAAAEDAGGEAAEEDSGDEEDILAEDDEAEEK
ncbi:MAG: transcription termination factor NusA [Planctomycetota bacterium]|jgi:N utilization substance protein A